MTNRELEVKYAVKPGVKVKDIELLLKNKGYVFQSDKLQQDVYYDTADYAIINLKRGLRLRNESDRISFEFKSLFYNEKAKFIVEEISLLKDCFLDIESLDTILNERLDLNVQVPPKSKVPSEEISAFMFNIGLIEAVTLNKQRRNYVKDNCVMSIDDISSVGLFLEVEIGDGNEDTLEKVQQQVESFKELNLRQTDEGYINILFSNNKNILSSQEFNKKFKQNCRWNVTDNEVKIVDDLFDC